MPNTAAETQQDVYAVAKHTGSRLWQLLNDAHENDALNSTVRSQVRMIIEELDQLAHDTKPDGVPSDL